MLDRRSLIAAAAASAAVAGLPAQAAPSGLRLVRFAGEGAELTDGEVRLVVGRGKRFGPWTLVELVPDAGFVVLEDFTSLTGRLLLVGTGGVISDLGKTAESTAIESPDRFFGRTREEIMAAEHDLLGAEILAKGRDPTYADVEKAFPPIQKLWGGTYNFLGTPQNLDKVWFAYGGRSPNFDPAVFQPSVETVRKDGRVLDGLVGGHLPILRFVYPDAGGAWTELLAFAPFRTINGNTRVQPVWYRVSRIENGELAWTKHVDSYLPYPPRTGDDPKGFYRDLVSFQAGWAALLAQAMTIETPEARVTDMARFGLVRSMMGRSAGFPKYGAVDKNYGGTEHDGFPDTFTVETEAMLDWGLVERAGAYIDNYFGRYVRDDGAILYRGPETGQFGRMLTVVARYVQVGGDPKLVLRHRRRIDAVADILSGMRAKAKTLARTDPAYGMISGWSEADAVLEADPPRYMQPYFSNSTEAARGFAELGRVWTRLGRETHDPALSRRGERLVAEAAALETDIQTAIGRSVITSDDETILPTIAGAKAPFHRVLQTDKSDPQWRAYRANMEMLHSGDLTPQQINWIVDYRERHHDVLLGVPLVYGLNTGEMGGFLSYGHGYGLIQADRIREALLMTYSLMAHQYTRGGWLAPETRAPMTSADAGAYCGPSQLSVPLVVRWLMVFEEPRADVLWLGKGLPRPWLQPGKTTAVRGAPTRWGRVGYRITAHEGRIDAAVTLPKAGIAAETRLRLRAPAGRMKVVTLGGRTWSRFDADQEFVTIPPGLGGPLRISATY